MNALRSLSPGWSTLLRPARPAPWALAACAAVLLTASLTALVGLGDLVFWSFLLVMAGLCVYNVATGGVKSGVVVFALAGVALAAFGLRRLSSNVLAETPPATSCPLDRSRGER